MLGFSLTSCCHVTLERWAFGPTCRTPEHLRFFFPAAPPSIQSLNYTPPPLPLTPSPSTFSVNRRCRIYNIFMLQRKLTVLASPCKFSMSNRNTKADWVISYNRARKMTKMTKEVANGVLLSGVIKVYGFFSSSMVNSTVGEKLFHLLLGEMILATLDGFVWSKDIRGDKRRASSMRVCPWNGLNSFQDQTI
ncbi:LOW QUALITY PROTEIN: hypothetical protein HID58_023256 [Brassica napus]|uniref:Chlorophyll a-b binding protein, chloroplastic n=1 Tax=Brassica napus TaxID=3708 RepID=A0ABQ8D1W3_BRANA|nr:LOW QUALITY PROTEIN: hypothetical protein HID58_023256 [Brassica napus]